MILFRGPAYYYSRTDVMRSDRNRKLIGCVIGNTADATWDASIERNDLFRLREPGRNHTPFVPS